MINKISKISGYQVVTKYYCGEYCTKEDAERIEKLMSALDRVIDFALKNNYLVGVSDVEFPFIDVKNGTCDFIIHGFNTIPRPHYYTSDKKRFISGILAQFAICKIKSFDWSDEVAKEKLERFNDIADDIIKLSLEKAVVIERIMKLDNIYDADGHCLTDDCPLIENNEKQTTVD